MKNELKAERLPRIYGWFSGAMLNMGANIGADVFLIQGAMIDDVGSPGIVIILFIAAGILSFLGTWAFTELGCMIPVSGGPKEYLAAAFKKPRGFIGFVFIHVWIWITMPGQVAAGSIAAGKYFLQSVWGPESVVQISGPKYIGDNYELCQRYVGGIMLVIIHVIHSLCPRKGMMVMDYLTILKIATLLFAICVGIAAYAGKTRALPTENYTSSVFFGNSKPDINTLVNSFFQVLFIYDGWNTTNYSLSEMKNPVRNLPKSSFFSVILTIILYVSVTVSFFVVVPVNQLGEKNDIIGIQFFKGTLGNFVGGKVLPTLICLAGFSCTMTMCFSNSRLIFEASNDHMLPPMKLLSKVSRFKSPIWSLVLNFMITMLFVFLPPPGQAYKFLTTLASYPTWIFLGLTVVSLMMLRSSHKEEKRPIKSTWLGNILFVIVCLGLTVIPFFPPPKVTEDMKNIPYWLVPAIAWGHIIFFCVLWFFYSVIFKKMEGSSNEDIFERVRRETEDDEFLILEVEKYVNLNYRLQHNYLQQKRIKPDFSDKQFNYSKSFFSRRYEVLNPNNDNTIDYNEPSRSESHLTLYSDFSVSETNSCDLHILEEKEKIPADNPKSKWRHKPNFGS